MKTLYFLRGLPASGKTTWAREKLAALNSGGEVCAIRTCKDEIREQIRTPGTNCEDLVVNRETELVTNALKTGLDVIVDNTHFHPSHELRYRQLAKEHEYRFELKSFTQVPLQECIRRDKNRPNPVGEGVIRHMYAQYLNPKLTWSAGRTRFMPTRKGFRGFGQ